MFYHVDSPVNFFVYLHESGQNGVQSQPILTALSVESASEGYGEAPSVLSIFMVLPAF